MRAFIAIDLPAEIKAALAKIQNRLKTSLPKINWVKPENLHLSLKFLGDISLNQLEDIRQVIEEITKTACPVQIKLETPGVFPSPALAKIIWLGTEQLPDRLKQLVEELDSKLCQIGFAREKRPFQAHITIGRIKHNIITADLKKELGLLEKELDNLDLSFTLPGLTLFQSVLGRQGPTYSILSEVKF